MADKLIPCRIAFSETILHEAQKNPDIFVVTSDARGSVTLDDFANSLPEQFIEVGIAEQNAVGVGAGLALAGKNVFVCGPACFYSARSLEQVKVDVAYSKTSVKIIGVSGAVSEVISQNYPVKMKILGIPDENVINATPLALFEHYGLTGSGICRSALELLKRL